MRVLHITPYLSPIAGGPSVVVEKLSSVMPTLGWHASVVTTSLYCIDSGESLRETANSHGYDLSVLPIATPRFLRRPRGAAHVIDKAVSQADIVHLHTLWHPLNRLARKACQRHGRKYVLMPHGMLDPYCLSKKKWRKKFYLAGVEKRNIQRASRLIFTAEHEKQGARESLPWIKSGDVIPLAADEPPCVPRDRLIGHFVDLFPQALNRRCLLFLGRIHEKKGLDRLVTIMPEVISQHADALLVIAGTGDPGYVEEVCGLVRAQNLERYVLFTGMLTGEAKFGAFASARVFLLPSRQENFALSVAEAMQMGVPVIISDKVNSWPLVKRANGGFVLSERDIESALARADKRDSN